MIYSENLTNRELVMNAMPLVSLSREQWNTVLKHLENIEVDSGSQSVLFTALHTVIENQSRLEVIGNYFDYYGDLLSKPVREKSVKGVYVF